MAEIVKGVGRALSDGFTMVKESWPPLRYVSPYFGLQLGRADALLGSLHRLYDEGLGDDDDPSLLFVCTLRHRRPRRSIARCVSSVDQGWTEH